MAMIDEIRRVTSAGATVNPRMLSPLALAQIGDTVCDLYARVYLNDQFARTPHELHLAASRFVCAAGQASAYRRMEPFLTEEETAVFKRGATPTAAPCRKTPPPRTTTRNGLETLVGLLFLSGNDARLAS
jgi:ribonuclease-3 family protein